MEVRLNANKPKRTVSFLNVLLIMLIIILLAAGALSFLSYQNTGEIPFKELIAPPTLTPRFLFNIYGEGANAFKSPMSVYVSNSGIIYVANTEAHKVEAFDSVGKFLFSFGSYGKGPGQLAFPYGITQSSDGTLLVAEAGNGRIQKFDPKGKYLGVFIDSSNSINIKKPGPLFKDKTNKIYIGDLISHKIFIVSEKGNLIRTFKDIDYPHGICVDKDGRVLVSDGGNNRVEMLNSLGIKVLSMNNWADAQPFSMVRGVSVDSANRIYVSDTLASSIRIFDRTGKYISSFGAQGMENGNFVYPHGIFIDRDDKIYISDWGNNRIQVWSY